MKMRFVVDRIEDGGIAVCICDGADGNYEGAAFNVSVNDMPDGVSASDVFDAVLADGTVSEIVLLAEERTARMNRSKRRLRSLFNRNSSSDG